MRIVLVSPDDRSCRALGRELSRRASVEILGPCGTGAVRWLDPGTSRDGAVTVRRFRADYPVVAELERRLARAVAAGPADPALQERWVQERGPYSSALLDELGECAENCDVVVFFSLDSALTVLGLPLVGRPAVVVPSVVDWSLAGSEVLRGALARATGFVFASPEERGRIHALVGGDSPSAIADGSSAPFLEVARRVCAPADGPPAR